MKTAFLLLVSAGIVLGQPLPEAALRRAEALASETIPHLSLKEASFEDALSAVQRAWSERHPNDPLPVAVTDFAPPEGYRAEYAQRITLDLRNVPFIEALLYIGQAGVQGSPSSGRFPNTNAFTGSRRVGLPASTKLDGRAKCRRSREIQGVTLAKLIAPTNDSFVNENSG